MTKNICNWQEIIPRHFCECFQWKVSEAFGNLMILDTFIHSKAKVLFITFLTFRINSFTSKTFSINFHRKIEVLIRYRKNMKMFN